MKRIKKLPVLPLRGDRNFVKKVEKFFSSLPLLIEQINNTITEINKIKKRR